MFIVAALLASQLAAKPPKHNTSPDSSAMTLVEVQNDRNVPVTVYAQDSWGEFELGVVGADSTATLRVSDPVVVDGDIDFFVRPRGEPTQETGTVEVHRGERLGIIVPAKP
jgi:hypothetical protein